MLASWHFLDVLLPRGSTIWSAPGGNSQLVETRRVPEFPMSFSMNERFLWHLIPAMSKRTCCSTSTLAHIPPAWVHGFTAPPASFETLKD